MNALDAIYAQIPTVKGCKTGCNDCCGPVPFAPADAARMPSLIPLEQSGGMRLSPTKPGCMTCAYSTTKGCSIYNVRPLVCRLFAAVDHPMMTCPHGAKAHRPLTHEQAMKLVDAVSQVGP